MPRNHDLITPTQKKLIDAAINAAATGSTSSDAFKEARQKLEKHLLSLNATIRKLRGKRIRVTNPDPHWY